MQDPFAHPATEEQFPEIETEEDLHFYDRLSNIMSLLRNVHAELNSARHENFLNDILQNPEVEHYLEELSSLIPNPVMTGITHIQKLVEDLTQVTKTLKIDRTVTENPPDRTLYSSAHANGTSPCEPDRPTHFYSNVVKHTNHIPQTTIKPKPTTRPQQGKPTPANPNAAHHPSRLVAQFLPTGIPENLRPDPNTIVTELNTAIERSHPSRSVKIVTASFNPQGNLIISTRADQTANEILRYRDAVLPVLTNIGNSQHVELREDKKWFKIQIDAVNTSTISIGNERVPVAEETVHTELLECNPQYAQMLESIVSKPRWLRPREELLTTHRSSLVFATTDEEAAKLMLKSRSLAAFGRHCFIRAFQDRPPVTQCKNCWRLDHPTHKCKEDQCCRICSGPHDEKNHQHNDPADCQKCLLAQELGDTMDTSAEGFCPHDLRCANCLGNGNVEHNHPADARRCPARLEKYGTARDNERRAAKSDNPWSKTKPPKKPRNKNTPEGPLPRHNNNMGTNRFTPLATSAATDPQQHSAEPTHQTPMEP